MVSAVCPDCNILLVEANSPTFSNLGAAELTAAAAGPVSIGNSYGGAESSSEASYDSYYGAGNEKTMPSPPPPVTTPMARSTRLPRPTSSPWGGRPSPP
jgi:hypothetical protein